MARFEVSGINVNFPFTPYESQKDFMTKVIEALQNNQNALLESPTGTGKTLCLLCASLAWLETHQAHVQLQMVHRVASTEATQQLEEQLKAGVGADQLPSGFGQSRVRIIYASRTHTQLSQVMNELKRTSYTGFRTAVIASRDQLCIHPTVSKEPSNQAKQNACRIKVQTRTCHFYNNVEKKKDLRAFNNPDDPKSNILDIEDLRKLGNRHKCCPYYVTRAAAKDYADIIFMPYNYLIDPSIRKRHGIDLDGAIVIFDEAHNLAQIAEESSSVEISAVDLTSALAEIDAVFTYVETNAKDLLEGDNFQSNENDKVDFELLTLENLAKVKAVLLDVEREMTLIELNKDKELKAGGEFMFELLAKAMLAFDTYLPIYHVIDAAVAYLTSGGYSGIHSKAYGLGRFMTFLKVVFESDSYNVSKPPEMRKAYMAQFYKVYVHDRDPPKGKSKRTFWENSNTNNGPVRVLAFWCFSPGFSMTDLQKQGVRCILLTSGTLKPLASFSSELRIPFPVTLENPHVISPSQISVSVVKQGPESVVLNSNYENRSDPRYHNSLGYAIMQIAKAVPNGMLVFFPSYHIMRMIVETWNNGHIMKCIQRYKQFFVEPTDKEEFQQAMDQYYAMVNDATANGAIFCGVCRGKVSEGLDFVDKNGRAVVITGIPYAPAKDPRVMMKRSYLDQQVRDSTNKTTLTGSQWYSQQASRAVNQAIGRVIRHKFDYGAILLLDTRFSSSYTQQELPTWVRSHLVVHDTFSSVIRMLNKFFQTIPALVAEKKAKAELAVPAKPSGLPRVSLNDSAPESRPALSVRSLYTDVTVSEDKLAAESVASGSVQPVRKKIKMQKVTAMVGSFSPSSTEGASSSLREVTNATQQPPAADGKGQEKLKLASEALHQCRMSLTKEKFIAVKSSLLKYHQSRDINDMKRCISVLLEQETTHSVIARFRDLISPKQQPMFDELESQLRSSQGHSAANVSESADLSEGLTQLTQVASDQYKSRYAATLTIFTECKKKLTASQNKLVKTALVTYKNKGSVSDLFNSVSSVGTDISLVLLKKLRGALRDSDKEMYDDLLTNLTNKSGQTPCTSTQLTDTDKVHSTSTVHVDDSSKVVPASDDEIF